jgi:hypothetical protein
MLYKNIWNEEYKLYIWIDEYVSSPRNDDNLWIILSNYKKCNLWDEEFKTYWESMQNDFAIYISRKYNVCDINDYYNLTSKESNKIWQWIEKNIFYDILSLTDHSNISLNIWHPKDKWDSWYIWYIYCHKNKIKENFCIKKISEEYKNKSKDIFKWEIENYNQYLSWEIYEYILEKREVKIIDWKEFYTEWDNLESCWWFYSKSEIAEHIDSKLFTKEWIKSYYI